jgi:peptidoglycan/xylan/chitin deacetylase (PgdA/CDA1 family)
VKQVLKKVVQSTVAAVAPQLWRLRGASLLVIMYHRVLPADHPDRKAEQPGMYVSPQTLAMHLRVLQSHFELVHLDDWLDAVAQGRTPPRRACAITFDDGWRDNYQFAYPLLRQANAPATVYLVSDFVGTHYSFWPNRLARILAGADDDVRARLPEWLRSLLPARADALSTAEIDNVISQCKGRSDAQMLAVVGELEGAGATPGQADRDLMSWEEIREMQASGFIRFGSHTRRHTRLSLVSGSDALQDEVIGSREVIDRKLGSVPRTFCYPNGDTSPQAIATVRSAYQGAVTTAHGWNAPTSDPFVLNRIGVHEDVSHTRAAFLSRLTGVG